MHDQVDQPGAFTASNLGLRTYPSRSSASVTRRRVSGATSSRPLTTFDAVGTDTPASRATTASVGPAATLALAVRTIGNHLSGPPVGRESFDQRGRKRFLL